MQNCVEQGGNNMPYARCELNARGKQGLGLFHIMNLGNNISQSSRVKYQVTIFLSHERLLSHEHDKCTRLDWEDITDNCEMNMDVLLKTEFVIDLWLDSGQQIQFEKSNKFYG